MIAHGSDDPEVPARLVDGDNLDAALLRFLLDSRSFGEDVGEVSMVESRMSLVFLAGERAYKMKKPIAFDSVDFRSLENRRANCERELALNRILSPDIYLGLLAVTHERTGKMRLGGTGEPIEWLVVMRRLKEERLLDHAIERGTVSHGDITSLIENLAPFYASSLDDSPSETEVLARTCGMLERTSQSLQRPDFGLPQVRIEPVLKALTHLLDECKGLIAARVAAGWIRDCHGDLRPQHVYLGPPLRLIDRLEFDARLRQLDPFEEIMDFGLECERLGAAWILPMLLDGISARLDGRPDERLIALYGAMRASLRARFAIEHIGGTRGTPEQWRALALASLDLAARYAYGQS